MANLKEIQRLFEAALQQPEEQRSQFLLDACGSNVEVLDKVLALLQYADDETEDSKESTNGRDADPLLGSVLDKYTIRSVIGEGGFGVVYMAEQSHPVKRRVAVKVIKLGMNSKAVVARFEAERQALALMDHPGVARIFDGGTTDQGRPFFVMELVDGIAITDFCDRHSYTIEERVKLFRKVCDAVQHAHHKGVIHRDLKPSNILVEYKDRDPDVKVIDFGIAKALNQDLSQHTLFTVSGQLIGTPEYMSPEQAEMSALNVDTRSDVYSLGIVLYQLLSGYLPFEPETLRAAGIAEIQRIIREVDPPMPSTRFVSVMTRSQDESLKIAKQRQSAIGHLPKHLKGDLDWVTMKCLEKERSRRYDSPSELSQDLERFLKNRPVQASPPSWTYQAKKFFLRNKPASIAAMLAAVLIGFAGTLIYGLADATREQTRIAENKSLVADQSATFIKQMITSVNPWQAKGKDNELFVSVLHELPERARQTFGESRGLQASILHSIAEAFCGLGNYEDCDMYASMAMDIYREIEGDDSLNTLRSMQTAATGRHSGDRPDSAIEILRLATEIAIHKYGRSSTIASELIPQLAWTLAEAGYAKEGLQLSREHLHLKESEGNWTPKQRSDALYAYCFALGRSGRFVESHEIARELSELVSTHHGPDSQPYHNAKELFVDTLIDLHRLDEAETACLDLIDSSEAVYGKDSMAVAEHLVQLGRIYWSAGDSDKAADAYQRNVEIVQRKLGTNNRYSAIPLLSYGRALMSLDYDQGGDASNGVDIIREAYELIRSSNGSENIWTLKAGIELVKALVAYITQADTRDTNVVFNDTFVRMAAEAVTLAEDTLALARSTYGESEKITAEAWSALGDATEAKAYLQEDHRGHETARDILREASRVADLAYGPTSEYAIATQSAIAYPLFNLGQVEEALAVQRRYLERAEKNLPDGHPTVLHAMWCVAYDIQALGRIDESIKLWKALHQKAASHLGKSNSTTLSYYDDLSIALIENKQHQRALEIRNEIHALSSASLGAAHPTTLHYLKEIATTLQDMGDQDTANEILHEVFSLAKEKYGADSLTTGLYLSWLIHASSCDYGDGPRYEVIENELDWLTRELGRSHPLVIKRINDFSSNAYNCDDVDLSLELQQEAFNLCLNSLPPQDPLRQQTEILMAEAFIRADEPQIAMQVWQDMFTTYSESHGPSHSMAREAINGMGRYYLESLDYAKALNHFREAYTHAADELGERHETTLSYRSNMALALIGLTDYETALPQIQEAYIIARESNYVPLDKTISFGLLYTDALAGLHRFEEALKATEEILDLIRQTKHPYDSWIEEALLSLADLASRNGEHDRSRSYFEELRDWNREYWPELPQDALYAEVNAAMQRLYEDVRLANTVDALQFVEQAANLPDPDEDLLCMSVALMIGAYMIQLEGAERNTFYTDEIDLATRQYELDDQSIEKVHRHILTIFTETGRDDLKKLVPKLIGDTDELGS